MPNARVDQVIVEITILEQPNARVDQAVVEICVGPPPVQPPVPGQGVAPVGAGAPALARQYSKGGCTPHITHYDYCLEAEALLLRQITFPPSCSIPEEYMSSSPWDEDRGLFRLNLPHSVKLRALSPPLQRQVITWWCPSGCPTASMDS